MRRLALSCTSACFRFKNSDSILAASSAILANSREFWDLVLHKAWQLLSRHFEGLLLEGFGYFVFTLLVMSHGQPVQQQSQIVVLYATIGLPVALDTPLQVFYSFVHPFFMDAVLADVAEETRRLAVVLFNG